MGGTKGGSGVDRSINHGQITPWYCSVAPILIIMGFLSFWRQSRMDKISQHQRPWKPLTWPYLVVQILPFPRGKPPIASGPFRSTACDPATRRESSDRVYFTHLRGMQPIWSGSWVPPPLLKQFLIHLTLYKVWCPHLTL